MQKRVIDIIQIIAIGFMILGGCLLTYYYLKIEINSCTSDPLKYAVEQIMEDENYTYSYISLNIYLSKEDNIPIKSFNLDLKKEKRAE